MIHIDLIIFINFLDTWDPLVAFVNLYCMFKIIMTLLVLFKFSYLWFSAFYWVVLIVLYFSVLVTIDEMSVLLLALLFGLYNVMVILLNASYIAIVAMSMLFFFLIICNILVAC